MTPKVTCCPTCGLPFAGDKVTPHDCPGYDSRDVQAPEQGVVCGVCYGPLDEDGNCRRDHV